MYIANYSVVRTDLTVFESPQYPNQKLQIDVNIVQSYPGSNNPLSKQHLLISALN